MIKILKIFNIEIQINFSLLPILILGLFFGFLRELAILFFIITLHELAHSLTSKYYGYETEKIELSLFGGAVKTDEIIFLEPKKVILISIVGPMLNFAFFFVSISISKVFGINNDLLNFFIYANLSLGIFNLLPVLPLDGGRMLRACLNKSLELKEATFTTVFIGNIVCMILFILGTILVTRSHNGIVLIVFSVYLYIKNNKEKEMIIFLHMQRVITKPKNVQKKLDIKIKYISANEYCSLKDTLKNLSVGNYCIIKVINNRGKMIGELSEGEILEAIINYNSLITLEELLKIKDNSL